MPSGRAHTLEDDLATLMKGRAGQYVGHPADVLEEAAQRVRQSFAGALDGKDILASELSSVLAERDRLRETLAKEHGVAWGEGDEWLDSESWVRHEPPCPTCDLLLGWDRSAESGEHGG